MADSQAGNIARQMAATTPKQSERKRPEPDAALEPATPAVAGADLETALHNAQMQSAARSAERISGAIMKNPIIERLGLPVWALGDRKIYPAKDYRGNEIAGKTNCTLAKATFTIAPGLTFTATVYQDHTIGQDASGPYEDHTDRFSLPKVFLVDKQDPTAGANVEQFKDAMIKSYNSWIAKIDMGVPVAASRTPAGVQSRRVRPAAPAPAPA